MLKDFFVLRETWAKTNPTKAFYGAKPLTMFKQKYIFVRSLIVLPMLSSMPFGTSSLLSQADVSPISTEVISIDIPFTTNTAVLEDQILKEKAEKIDKYFADREMPLAGYGEVFVTEAEKNGLDWALIAAIAVRESSGGKNACKKATHSFLGWGSCKINFSSKEEAIATVARNLGGNNPNTASHYAGRDTIGILESYNPRTVVYHYPEQVVAIMNDIKETEIETVSPETQVALISLIEA